MKTMNVDDEDTEDAGQIDEIEEQDDEEVSDALAETSSDEGDDEAEESHKDEGTEDDQVATEGELTFEIEGAAPEDDAPTGIKELRRSHREAVRENRELKRQLAEAAAAQQSQSLEDVPEPDLADFDYDPELFKKAHREWMVKQVAVAERRRVALEAEKQQAAEFQERMAAYVDRAKKLGVPDYVEAEETLIAALHPNQLRAILDAANEPEKVVYALSKNPTILEQLANEKNMVRFIAEVARMETKIKTTRKTPPPPEKRIESGVSGAGAVSSQAKLDRLRAEASKTGNFDAYLAYKRKVAHKAA